MLTFEDIYATIKENESTYNHYNVEAKRPGSTLPNDYVIDENESVKWNREQVAIHNNAIKEEWKEYREASYKGWYNFRNDLKEAISNEYGFSDDQAACIIGRLYDGSMNDVADHAREICDLLEDFLTRDGPKEFFHN